MKRFYPFIFLSLILFSCQNDDDQINLKFNSSTIGCFNFFGARANEEMDQYITVDLDLDSLAPEDDVTYTYSISSSSPDNLTVQVVSFDEPTQTFFCDDVIDPTEPQVVNVWTAVNGTVTIVKREDLIIISLDQVNLIDEQNSKVHVNHVKIETKPVYPG